MTTIGYGDITPQTQYERGYIIIVALLATNVFAYSFSQISEIVKNEEQKRQNYNKMMRGINNEMNKRGLNLLLQHKVRKYYEYIQLQNEQRQGNQNNIFDTLPQLLKEEVLQDVNAAVIEEIYLLKQFSPECKKVISLCIKQKVYFPEETIFQENETNDCIYFVAQGSVTFSLLVKTKLKGDKSIPHLNILTLQKRAVFGYESFLLGKLNPYSARSNGVSVLSYINQQDLLMALKEFPFDYEIFAMIRDEAMINYKTQNLNLSCNACGDFSHSLNKCPYVNPVTTKPRLQKEEVSVNQRSNFNRKRSSSFSPLAQLYEIQEFAKEIVFELEKEEVIQELLSILEDPYSSEFEDQKKNNKQKLMNSIVMNEDFNDEEFTYEGRIRGLTMQKDGFTKGLLQSQQNRLNQNNTAFLSNLSNNCSNQNVNSNNSNYGQNAKYSSLRQNSLNNSGAQSYQKQDSNQIQKTPSLENAGQRSKSSNSNSITSVSEENLFTIPEGEEEQSKCNFMGQQNSIQKEIELENLKNAKKNEYSQNITAPDSLHPKIKMGKLQDPHLYQSSKHSLTHQESQEKNNQLEKQTHLKDGEEARFSINSIEIQDDELTKNEHSQKKVYSLRNISSEFSQSKKQQSKRWSSEEIRRTQENLEEKQNYLNNSKQLIQSAKLNTREMKAILPHTHEKKSLVEERNEDHNLNKVNLRLKVETDIQKNEKTQISPQDVLSEQREKEEELQKKINGGELMNQVFKRREQKARLTYLEERRVIDQHSKENMQKINFQGATLEDICSLTSGAPFFRQKKSSTSEKDSQDSRHQTIIPSNFEIQQAHQSSNEYSRQSSFSNLALKQQQKMTYINQQGAITPRIAQQGSFLSQQSKEAQSDLFAIIGREKRSASNFTEKIKTIKNHNHFTFVDDGTKQNNSNCFHSPKHNHNPLKKIGSNENFSTKISMNNIGNTIVNNNLNTNANQALNINPSGFSIPPQAQLLPHQQMNNSVQIDQNFSSEYKIRCQEGLEDLDMLICRKNLRLEQEKGRIFNFIMVSDNEHHIDKMQEWHIYFKKYNYNFILYKFRKYQDEQFKILQIKNAFKGSIQKPRKSKLGDSQMLTARNALKKSMITSQIPRKSVLSVPIS